MYSAKKKNYLSKSSQLIASFRRPNALCRISFRIALQFAIISLRNNETAVFLYRSLVWDLIIAIQNPKCQEECLCFIYKKRASQKTGIYYLLPRGSSTHYANRDDHSIPLNNSSPGRCHGLLMIVIESLHIILFMNNRRNELLKR